MLSVGSIAVLSMWPTPPVQTPVQAAAWARANSEAKAASDAATPQVLSLFGSPAFQTALAACCPEVAGLSASELLDRYRAEARVAELAHNFPAMPSSGSAHHHWVDETIALVETYPWFLNQWQAALVQNGTSNTSRPRFDPRLEAAGSPSDAETGIFGLPSFANPERPSWTEASDRLIYVAHNMRRRDTGSSYHFGDVSAIFRTSSVSSLVVIAPVDTGIWEGSCNVSAGTNPWRNLNCSYWPAARPSVATLHHFDHMILANPGLWAAADGIDIVRSMKALFARSALGGDYAAVPPLQPDELEQYWESDVVGNPKLDTVKFLIPLFGSLFGTDAGKRLQSLAAAKGWPLVWALADGSDGQQSGHSSSASCPANQRLLDPALAHLTNATLSAGATGAFEKVWAAAAAYRAAHWWSPSADVVKGWWRELAALPRLAPLTAFACSAVDSCIGSVVGAVEASAPDCVCVQ